MVTKLLFVLCVNIVIFGKISQAQQIVSNFYREETCSTEGGYCVLESECQSAADVEGDLCGAQKADGAICCKNFPVERANCYQLHNDCKETCPTALDIGTKGCTSGKTCCVLV